MILHPHHHSHHLSLPPLPSLPHSSSHLHLPSTTTSTTPPPLTTSTTPPPLTASTSTTRDPGLLFREKLLFLDKTLGLDPFLTLSQNPDLRSTPLSSLHSLHSLLLSFGLRAPDDTARVLSMNPSLLLLPDPDPALRPILHFLLHQVRLRPPCDLRTAVLRCPRILVSSVPLRLLPTLHFLRRLGFVGRRRITHNTTVLLISSVEDTLIPKLDYIRSLGFSYKEAVGMILRSPGLFTYSIEKNFKPKVEFLTGEMGRDVREVWKFPQFFSFSLEGRIKPRYRLLVERGLRMSLPEMLKMSDGAFEQRLLEMRLSSVEGRV